MTNDLEKVLQDRGVSYGNFADIAYLTGQMTEALDSMAYSHVQREAIHMICHKLARICCGDPSHRDSWLDIAGYAQLAVTDLDERDPA